MISPSPAEYARRGSTGSLQLEPEKQVLHIGSISSGFRVQVHSVHPTCRARHSAKEADLLSAAAQSFNNFSNVIYNDNVQYSAGQLTDSASDNAAVGEGFAIVTVDACQMKVSLAPRRHSPTCEPASELSPKSFAMHAPLQPDSPAPFCTQL